MTVNDELAKEVIIEVSRAIAHYLSNKWTSEQFITRMRQIVKALNLG